jgi:hypothetical protein
MSYADFLDRKKRVWTGLGSDADVMPSVLYPFQAAITKWAVRKGRAAIFADCGLGKTLMQCAWAQTINERTLFVAPLCVAEQTVHEATMLNMTVHYARTEHKAEGHRFVITNYERVDDFDLSRYRAVVLDESSILKAFDGKTRSKLIALCKDVPYRLCCTATPSPNDIAELANHAEFFGLMTRAEFLATWFVHDDAGWRMKRHAVTPFYRWLASWAIALRTPSDIGYSDDGFALPALTIQDSIIRVEGPTGDMLFPELSTKGLKGRLTARKGSLEDRCQTAVQLITDAPKGHKRCQWLVWCGLNDEANRLSELLPDAVNVQGSDTYAEKVGAVQGFLDGRIRILISKPKILGFGMNFQCCHHMAFVGLSDSYESYYQCVRRSWRFGQQRPVTAHVIISEAEQVIVENVRRKEAAAANLADSLLVHMASFEREELSA